VLQADVKLIGWPPRAPDMNHIENMWSEVKKTVQETWRKICPRIKDALQSHVSDAWDEVASSQRYVRHLIEFVPRRMTSLVDDGHLS
jgi:hypothetical protein